MINDYCTSWTRLQSVVDKPNNVSFTIPSSFAFGNVSFGVGDEVISLDRTLPDYMSPRRQYTVTLTLYNQLEDEMTDLVYNKEDLLNPYFIASAKMIQR